MVIFVITKQGFSELKSIICSGLYPVWFGENVLSELDCTELEALEIEVSVFSYSIEPDDTEALECALHTIAEHHPNQRIWVELMPNLSA